jgi:nitrite reductase/ring-hydroxylating ferredoxin subunit
MQLRRRQLTPHRPLNARSIQDVDTAFQSTSQCKHEEKRMSEFIKALSNSELEEGSILAVRINGERIALYKIGGEIYATSEMCSHSDCSLEDFGKIVESDQVECICHGARFRIKTGEVTRVPAEVPLKTYAVRVEENEVWVLVP